LMLVQFVNTKVPPLVLAFFLDAQFLCGSRGVEVCGTQQNLYI
jgi:hypothetical protein